MIGQEALGKMINFLEFVEREEGLRFVKHISDGLILNLLVTVKDAKHIP